MSIVKAKSIEQVEKEQILNDLVDRINEITEQAEENDTDPNGSIGEYCSDFGYGESEIELDNLESDTVELIKSIPVKDRKRIVAECSEVVYGSMYIKNNEVFSVSIGETEHQFDDDTLNQLKALTDEEYEYVRNQVNCYIRERSHSCSDCFYINHGCDRMILVLDTDLLAEKVMDKKWITAKKKAITEYLENECHFRDYKFLSAKQYGKKSVKASINLLNPSESDLEDALNTFVRDGYSTIVIYLGIK